MCDTFRPLKLTTLSRDLDDPAYAYSWYEEGSELPPRATRYAGLRNAGQRSEHGERPGLGGGAG